MTAKSSVPMGKLPTGIAGFDDISRGGLPRGRTTLLLGGPGCGKTVFALQTLVNYAKRLNEAGLFVAFEESTQHVKMNAAPFGWNLDALDGKKLIFFDACLSPDVVKAGTFDLEGMLTILGVAAKKAHATCIVFDGLDVPLGLLDDTKAERREIFRIRDWLTRTGLTGIITQKMGEPGHDAHSAFLQFMVDCVVVLRHEVIQGAAFRNLRIVKFRGSGFSGDEFPMAFDNQGIHVMSRGTAERQYRVTSKRVSTGLPRLDAMLSGGYHRQTSVLISGTSGSAKSTLAGLFVAAACARGERSMYVSFDEAPAQIVRNLKSVGIQLAPAIKSGLLDMVSTRPRGMSVEQQFAELRARVRAHRPRCMAIDPFSAMSASASQPASSDAAQQFMDFLKQQGVTVVVTGLMETPGPQESNGLHLATLVDTWVHVSQMVQGGERNRALMIVKSRGTAHSNQVRELILSNQGVDLTDHVHATGGRELRPGSRS